MSGRGEEDLPVDRPAGVPPITPFGGDDAVLDLLQAVSRQLVAMTASALARLEAGAGIRVSLPEYRVLVLLSLDPGRRPSELAVELEVTRPAIAQILGRLESARLVTRRTDRADRRSARLSLTTKGSRVVQAVLAERESRLRPALAALSARDRRALGVALARLDTTLASGPSRQARRASE